DWVYLTCVGINVVNLYAPITARSPTLELLRVSHQGQAGGAPRENFLRRMLTVFSSLRIAGNQQQAISHSRTDFTTVNEQDGAVFALQGHLSGVEVRRWAFGHHHKIEFLRFTLR